METADRGHSASYVDDIFAALSRNPDGEALIFGSRRMTAGELCGLTHRLARVLRMRGLGPGGTIALLSGNIPEALALRYAAYLVGCRITYLRHDLSAELHGLLLQSLGDHVLVVDPRYVDRAAELAALAPVKDMLLLGTEGLGDRLVPPGAEDVLRLAAFVSAEPFACLAPEDAVFSLLHTGGSTGHPKAVCHTAAQQVGFRRQLLALRPAGDRELLCTPLAAIGGYLADLALLGGGTVVLLEGFQPAEVLEVIERQRVSGLFLPPPLLFALMDHADVSWRDLSSLQHLLYGGCAAAPGRIAEALERFGPVLVQVYGQTESGLITALAVEDHNPRRPELLRSVGKPMPGVQVAVRDTSGHDLSPGTVGEVCVRSDLVMGGLLQTPRAHRGRHPRRLAAHRGPWPFG
ncbi:AMP-binding protein [Streptomyces sp. NPDC056773]|uniref:AMP-binding protein n=1 Tax=unclassified Streptomyces TaxID=2593676 RepID=UPI0036A7EB8D